MTRQRVNAALGTQMDFDGDAIGLLLALDSSMSKELNRLQPHYNVYDMSKPRSVSNVMAIPKPVIANINNWLDEKQEYVNYEQMNRFLV